MRARADIGERYYIRMHMKSLRDSKSAEIKRISQVEQFNLLFDSIRAREVTPPVAFSNARDHRKDTAESRDFSTRPHFAKINDDHVFWAYTRVR